MSETFDLAYGDPRSRLVNQLRQQIGDWEASVPEDELTFSTGTAALDQLLGAPSKPSPPGRGQVATGDSPWRGEGPLRYGMLVEWLSNLAQGGAATLSLLSAREACRSGGMFVVIDRLQHFYPPAATAWGIDLDRLLIVRPRDASEARWAAIQSLRSPAVAAVWAPFDRLDSRQFRQLQLAAQAGRTLGLLLRPAHVRGQPSWADVRLAVCPLSVVSRQLHSNHGQRTTDNGRSVHIQILRQRGARPGGSIILEIDDTNHTVQEGSRPSALGYRPGILANSRKPKADSPHHHDSLSLPVVSELAHSTPPSLPARA
jgi:hypothetical protein